MTTASQNPAPSHWLRNLPEAGDDLIALAAEIEGYNAEIARIQQNLAAAEDRALKLAGDDWSYDEIEAAGGQPTESENDAA